MTYQQLSTMAGLRLVADKRIRTASVIIGRQSALLKGQSEEIALLQGQLRTEKAFTTELSEDVADLVQQNAGLLNDIARSRPWETIGKGTTVAAILAVTIVVVKAVQPNPNP